MATTVSIETIQEYEMGVLHYIDDVCSANGLKYYLAYGSLLGAVRHQGFIPWDDDMDIYMPRPDYVRFLEVTNANPHPRYKVCSVDNEKRWTAPLPKVIDTYTVLKQTGHREQMDLGIYIDIFVLDGVPAEQKERENWIRKLNLLHKIWTGCEYEKKAQPGSGLKGHVTALASKLLHNFVGANRAARNLCAQARKYAYEDCDWVGDNECQVAKDRQKCIVEKAWFGEGGTMLFGDLQCPVPAQWDKLLTKWYGDYMTLPPEEARVSHHKYELEIKNS